MTKKLEEKQREATKVFRQKTEKKINDFSISDSQRLTLPPMSIVERQVI
jgi:hypothetical protein